MLNILENANKSPSIGSGLLHNENIVVDFKFKRSNNFARFV